MDHRLDVGEGPICSILSALVLLDSADLHLYLFTRILGELLHVALHEFHLGVQILVSLLSVLKLLFELQILDFQLVDGPLVLLLPAPHRFVGFGELVEFFREFPKFLIKLVHRLLVSLLVVL